MMNLSNYRLILIIGSMHLLPCLLSAQSKTINGTVKELHAVKNNISRPLPYAEIRLLDDNAFEDRKISKDSGLFCFNINKVVNSSKLVMRYENYIVVDNDPINKITWTNGGGETKDISILMCDPNKIARISDDYYSKLVAKLNAVFDEEYKLLKERYTQQLKDSIKSLQKQHDLDLATARSYANAFSRMEFTSDSSALYKAFHAYMEGDFKSCEEFLEDNGELMTDTKLHEMNTEVLINAWLIDADIKKARKDYIEAENCYQQAIDLSTSKYAYLTYNAYTDYLLGTTDYPKTEAYLRLKLNAINPEKDDQWYDETIYTYYQLANTYDTDTKTDSSYSAATRIYAEKDKILSDTGNERNYSLLVAALSLLGNNDEKVKFKDALKYLTTELTLLRTSPYKNLDSFPWVDGEEYTLIDIGGKYSDHHEASTALAYFKQAIDRCMRRAINEGDTSKRNEDVLDLNFFYESIWTSGVKKSVQLKYFSQELRDIESNVKDDRFKDKIVAELKGIIDLINQGTYGDGVIDTIFSLQMKQQPLKH